MVARGAVRAPTDDAERRTSGSDASIVRARPICRPHARYTARQACDRARARPPSTAVEGDHATRPGRVDNRCHRLHGTPMLPFPILIQPGESPVKQVVFAASKAILAGVMRPGDPFPSVRELSEELKLHPNSIQKVVAELVRDGFLAVRTGVGTVVTTGPRSPDPERRQLLAASVEQLVVEARRLGLGRDALIAEVDSTWNAVFGDEQRTGTHGATAPRRRPSPRGGR